MVNAIFIDFYGTVVHEDGAIIKKITQEIFDTGEAYSKEEIGTYWWKDFQNSFMSSYGDNFLTQRELEYHSICKTIKHFKSSADPKELSDLMFEHWITPPIFEDAKEFLKKCPVPIYIVSNIDRNDILKAIEFHRLKPNGVFTSEDAKSYKPRKELFEFALKKVGLSAKQVVHIGDSLSSDVKGASSVGINALWIKRSVKDIPDDIGYIENLMEVLKSSYLQWYVKKVIEKYIGTIFEKYGYKVEDISGVSNKF